jgi:hypothetical protein
MAEIVNDRDLLIMSASPRFTPPTDRGMFLTPPAAVFRASADGSTSTPPSFTFKATLLNMAGVVSFAASNGAKLTVNAATNEAMFDFAAYTAAGVETVYITATITVDGVPYAQQAIVTKVSDGAQGADGAQTAVARLYQFSTTVPGKPTGSSTFTWAGAWNGAYTGTDGWSVTVPANPGTPGLRLYVASVSVSGAAKATTTTVSYTGATVEAWTQNGATGTSGVNTGSATVYQWAATIPAAPVGNALFRWASNSFGEAPSGWSLAPVAASSVGMTLWAARVQLLDTATNGDTAFNWSAAAVMMIGYAGTNGGAGQPGASYVTAYCASATGNATSAPAATRGRGSLPAANSGGIVGTWSVAVPALAAGQYLYQSDGIFDPATDTVTWSIPYWSSLKVATLSAITANLGAINGGSMNLGNGTFTVDNAGNLICYSISIVDPNTGEIMLRAGGKLNPKYAPVGTLNSDQQWVDVKGAGKPADNATVGADSSNLNVGISRNLLSNSAPGTLAGYTFGISAPMNIESNTVILAQGSHPYKQYSPNNTCVYVHAIGTPPDGSVIDIYPNAGSMAPVIPKKRYEAGVSLSSHRCVGQVRIKWFDLNRVYIREDIGNALANNGANYLTLPFPRSTVFGIAPDNAAFAVVSATGLNNGGSDVHIFASQFYFGEATMAQTVPSNWIEGGASDTRALGFFGDLDATKGAEIGKNLAGQFTAANITTFIQAAAIGLALIDKASITNLAALSAYLGSAEIGPGGNLRQGQTAFHTGTGFWLGDSGGVPKFSIGKPGTSSLRWDGVQLIAENLNTSLTPLPVSITTTGGNLTTTYGRNASAASTVVGYVNVAGGSGNYTYNWSVTADGYACWTTNPAGSNCAGVMKGPGIAMPDGVGFTLVCTVTDQTTGRTGQATFSPTIIFQ